MRLGEPGLIERQVAEAGFRGARSARHTLDWLVADPEEGWRQQVLDGPPATREAIAALPDAERRALHEQYVAAPEAHGRDGAIRLPSEAIYLTALK